MRNHPKTAWQTALTGIGRGFSLRVIGVLLVLALVGAGFTTQLAMTPVARAQQSGTIVHDTVADFSPVCVTNTGLTVSDALGGELRLAPHQRHEGVGFSQVEAAEGPVPAERHEHGLDVA